MSGPASRRAALGAILAAPLATVPMGAAYAYVLPRSPALAALVAEYEEAAATFDAEWDAIADVPGASWDKMTACGGICGRLRARIALHPVEGLADIMLKVKACGITSLPDDYDELRHTIEHHNGCAYDDDVGRAVVLDLIRLVGAGVPCA